MSILDLPFLSFVQPLFLTVVPPPVAEWLVVPFLALLGLVATGPLLFPKFWEKWFAYVAVGLGVLMLLYYGLARHEWHTALETLAEYFSFVTLLAALYVVGGSIYLNIGLQATPWRNIILLFIGSVLASFIGTTGASLVLIRPFIRLNDERIRPYQIVFFIFLVSNTGGLLSPLGDPPLFIGYLRGVPFFWTLWHLLAPWLLATGLLLTLFWFIDRRNPYPSHFSLAEQRRIRREGGLPLLEASGRKNLIWLAIVLISVFIDPQRHSWVPSLHIGEVHVSFLRELLQLLAAWGCYRTASRKALRHNHFSFGPINEVVFLFFGIFMTMMPALQLAAHAASEPTVADNLTPTALFWLTGVLSAFLDNAPTYASFVSLSMAGHGLSISQAEAVLAFSHNAATLPLLRAISTGAVLFGAMTYIGNGPNFLVRSIARQEGVEMPYFFQYIGRYSIPYLLPVLAVVSLFLMWL